MATKPGPILALAGLAALFFLSKSEGASGGGGGDDGVPEGGLVPDPTKPGGGSTNTSSGGKKVPKGTGTGGSDYAPTGNKGPNDLWLPPDCSGTPFMGETWFENTFMPWVLAKPTRSAVGRVDGLGGGDKPWTADTIIALFFGLRTVHPKIEQQGGLLDEDYDSDIDPVSSVKEDLEKPYLCLAESPFFGWHDIIAAAPSSGVTAEGMNEFYAAMKTWAQKYPGLYIFLYLLQEEVRQDPQLSQIRGDAPESMFVPFPPLGEIDVIEVPMPDPAPGRDAHEGPITADPDKWWSDFTAWAQSAESSSTGAAKSGVTHIKRAVTDWYGRLPSFLKSIPPMPIKTEQLPSGQVVSDDKVLADLAKKTGPLLGFMYAGQPMLENYGRVKQWLADYEAEAKKKEVAAPNKVTGAIYRIAGEKMAQWGAQYEAWYARLPERDKMAAMVYPDGSKVLPDSTAIFLGTVFDNSGTPLKGVKVTLWNGNEDVTDELGQFAMMAVPNSQPVTFTRPSGAKYTEIVTLYPGAPRQNYLMYKLGNTADDGIIEDWFEMEETSLNNYDKSSPSGALDALLNEGVA